MKKVVLFLLLCVGMMACAVEQDSMVTTGVPSQIQEFEQTIKTETKIPADVMEMFKTGEGDIEVMACNGVPATQQPCNGTRNCGFTCCSGETRTIQEDCGYCAWRANMWCGSGVKSVFWY